MLEKWIWGKDYTVNGPGAWSLFHIMFILLTIVSTALVAYFLGRKHSKRLESFVTRIYFLLLFLLELGKQIMFTMYYHTYRFEFFPFDLCSVPIYASLISSLIFNNNNKVKKYCDLFNIYFGLIGGVAVMLAPGVVLNTPFIYKSLQTMIWHGILIIYSVYMCISKELYKKSIKELLPIFGILVGVVLIAIGINELVFYTYINKLPTPTSGTKDLINCFYISSHYITSYPLLDKIQPNVPYPVFILIFVIGISAIAVATHYALFVLPYSIYRKVEKTEKALNKKKKK